jgi:hypothetical protein
MYSTEVTVTTRANTRKARAEEKYTMKARKRKPGQKKKRAPIGVEMGICGQPLKKKTGVRNDVFL